MYINRENEEEGPTTKFLEKMNLIAAVSRPICLLGCNPPRSFFVYDDTVGMALFIS